MPDPRRKRLKEPLVTSFVRYQPPFTVVVVVAVVSALILALVHVVLVLLPTISPPATPETLLDEH